MANTQQNVIFSISTTPQDSDLDAAGFQALTYVAVSNVGNVGETGLNTNILSYDTLDTEVSDKAKGVSNAGDPDIEVARVFDDAGQIAMRAAAATNVKFAFKIERNDMPGGGSTNSLMFNRGLATGPKRPGGRVEDFDLEVFTLGLVQKEVVVDAT